MGWRTGVFKRAVLGRIPFGDNLRRAKRRYFGYDLDPTNLRSTIHHLDEMAAAIVPLGRTFTGSTVLEIGSGWFPIIPIVLAVRGAKRVFLSDLVPNLDEVTFEVTLKFLSANSLVEPHLLFSKSISDFPLTYLAPFRISDVEDGSIDFVISRTVLEHIPPLDLTDLLVSLRQKLAPDGLMLHYIDHSDHLEHSDKSISKVNFLTWSARKHRFIYWLLKGGENRLRHHEYRGIFEQAGYEVISASTKLHEPTRQNIKTLSLAEPFAAMKPEEIAIMSSLYVVRASAAEIHT